MRRSTAPRRLLRDKPRNQPFEAGPCQQAHGGTAEISSMSSIARKPKATFARGIDKFVLASLAFKIALDLRLSGLPNIDYRFAFQHRSG